MGGSDWVERIEGSAQDQGFGDPFEPRMRSDIRTHDWRLAWGIIEYDLGNRHSQGRFDGKGIHGSPRLPFDHGFWQRHEGLVGHTDGRDLGKQKHVVVRRGAEGLKEHVGIDGGHDVIACREENPWTQFTKEITDGCGVDPLWVE